MAHPIRQCSAWRQRAGLRLSLLRREREEGLGCPLHDAGAKVFDDREAEIGFLRQFRAFRSAELPYEGRPNAGRGSLMSISREHRYFYPIAWKQLSAVICFVRARGRGEECGRPHLQDVQHLGDGRWWGSEAERWRDGQGRLICRTLPIPKDMTAGQVKVTRVVLATAHRNHDTADNTDANLAALCQRCHMLHDRPEHERRRRITLHARKAVGDLFGDIYVRR